MVSVMNFLRKFIYANLETAEQPAVRGPRAEPEKSCYAKCLIFLVLLLPFSGWNRLPAKTIPQPEKIRQRGELRFVTGGESPKVHGVAPGVIRLERELGQLFARRLGVETGFFSGKPGIPANNLPADPGEPPDPELERHFKKRLPGLKRWFIQAGRRHDLDWRLLAAVAYQESRWEKRAVSPEGVKGLMMLTQATARELRINDRTDPATSIMGAAAYLRQTLTHFPAEIADPDRTWYALAAYNLGYAHIERARKLVQRKKGNPDIWVELRKVLPRMNDLPRLGRAHKGNHRGRVTVDYVHHIRQYYERLIRMTEHKTNQTTTGPADSDSI
jgi:membrane-bound lytic murein transglycosylase MltF